MFIYYDYQRGRNRIKRRVVWGLLGFIVGLVSGGYAVMQLMTLAVH